LLSDLAEDLGTPSGELAALAAAFNETLLE
jgi:hypothetical protein